MTDDELWRELEAHRARLLRLARRRCPSRADAEDVAADALLACATYPALDRDRIGPLLTALTMRGSANAARRRAVETRALPRLVTIASDPADDLLTEAEARWLRSVMDDGLTPVEASVLLLRAEGLVPRVAAERLGITERAAASALTRARAKMLAAWKATLGVVGWLRLRRNAPLAGTAAVALASFAAVLALPHLGGPPSTPLFPGDVRSLNYDPADVRRPARLDPQVPRSTVVDPAPSLAPSPAPPRPTPTPPALGVDPVHVPGAEAGSRGVYVHLDPSEPPDERLRRCVERGVTVSIDSHQVSVVCNT